MSEVYLSRRAQRIFLVGINLVIISGLIYAFGSHSSSKPYVNPFGRNSFNDSSPEPYERENATFVTLCHDDDLDSALNAVQSWEDRFNWQYHYNWVFLNNKEFSEEFKIAISNRASGDVQFGLVPESMWAVPSFIDKAKAKQGRKKLKEANVIYGESVPYRQMCRFFSGFFQDHELVKPFKYFWRVDPDTQLYCDLDYDVFKFMRENGKQYGFVITFREFRLSVETLWQSARKFFNANPKYVHPNAGMKFVKSEDEDDYNMCHFWTNFEIGDMDFFRSQAYQDYFNSLDRDGGFFYERWGDAPVHSIAVAAMMDAKAIHFFEDVGYRHTVFQHTPDNYASRGLKCSQRANKNVDWEPISCLREADSAFGLGLEVPA